MDANALPENPSWSGWRGAARDGRALWLPQSLPEEPVILWQMPTTGDGLSGVMATHELVVIADRDVTDTNDLFRCLDAETGLELWTLEYPALAKLDYGNSPRATPLLHEGVVYTLGAMGHLHAVELGSGELLWKKDLLAEFEGEIPIWGLSASPLIIDGQLIVTTGSEAAFLAALDPKTGRTLWTVAGRKPAYASFVVGTLAGRRQLIGYDQISLGGWDPQTGERLWELIPPESDDFNVPTPILLGEQLLVTTENNGTRLYNFDRDGRINPAPAATNEGLAPDTSTPVLTSGRVFGAWGRLYCLDARGDLSAQWSADDRAFRDYVSLIASPDRVLVTTIEGELILLDARSDSLTVCGRQQVITDNSEVHSHPAIVGTKLFLRSASMILCLELRSDQSTN